jgi:hypothetical protein
VTPRQEPHIPLSDATRRELRAADEKRKRNYAVVIGAAVAPVAMEVTWRLTRSQASVDKVGTWIFCAALLALLVFFLLFDRHSRRLVHVRQEMAVNVPGVAGPIRKTYETRYDYDGFSAADLHAYRRMHIWGASALFAFFVAAGYAAALFLGPSLTL